MTHTFERYSNRQREGAIGHGHDDNERRRRADWDYRLLFAQDAGAAIPRRRTVRPRGLLRGAMVLRALAWPYPLRTRGSGGLIRIVMRRCRPLAACVIFSACGACAPKPVLRPATDIEYERTGGGDILFTVTRKDGEFVYRIKREQGREATGGGTIADRDVRTTLSKIFDGRANLAGRPARSNRDRVEGTWVHVRIRIAEGGWLQVSNSCLVAELHPLEYCIRNDVEREKEKQEKETHPEIPSLWEGQYCDTGHRSMAQIIRDQKSWAVLWERVPGVLSLADRLSTNEPTFEIYAPRPPPEIDFTRFVAVAVFLGDRPTGGYEVQFLDPVLEKDVLMIRYRERKPAGAVTMAITQPFAIRLFPKADVRIEVVKVAE